MSDEFPTIFATTAPRLVGPEVVVEAVPLDVGPIETALVRARRRANGLRRLAIQPFLWWWGLMIKYLGRGV